MPYPWKGLLLLHLTTLCRLKQYRHLIWTVHKGSHQLHCNYFIYKLHLVKTGLVSDMNKTGSTHTTHCIHTPVCCVRYCNTEKLSIAHPSISQLSWSLSCFGFLWHSVTIVISSLSWITKQIYFLLFGTVINILKHLIRCYLDSHISIARGSAGKYFFAYKNALHVKAIVVVIKLFTVTSLCFSSNFLLTALHRFVGIYRRSSYALTNTIPRQEIIRLSVDDNDKWLQMSHEGLHITILRFVAWDK